MSTEERAKRNKLHFSSELYKFDFVTISLVLHNNKIKFNRGEYLLISKN